MGRKAEHNLTMVAAVRDEATGPLNSVASAVDKTAASAAAADDKLAASSDRAAKANIGRLSATKQVEFAMRAEKAAGNQLATELVVLERSYEILSVQMRQIVRTGGEIPETLRRQASAARESADAIRQRLNPAVSDFDKGFEKFKAAGITAALFAATMQTLGVAFGMLKTQLLATLPDAEKLDGEMSGVDKSLSSLRATLADPEWAKLPMIARLATAAYSLMNSELAETEQKFAAMNRVEAERERRQAAINRLIIDESGATETSTNAAEKNRQLLAKINIDDEQRRTKSAEKRRAERERELAEVQRSEEKRASIIGQLDQRIATGREQLYASNVQRMVDVTNLEIAEREKLEKQALGEQARRAQEMASTMTSVVQSVSASMTTAFGSMIDGSQNAEQAFGQMFKSLGQQALRAATDAVIAEGIKKAAAISTANTKIAADTSTAASGALSAHAGIPFVGLAIGLAAAAAIIAAIIGFKKFNRGGIVTDGRDGVDTVPALLSRGEMVLDAETTRRVLRVAGRSSAAPIQRFADGGVVSAQSGTSQQGTVNNFSINMLGAMGRAQSRRWLRDIVAPELEQLYADGQLRFV